MKFTKLFLTVFSVMVLTSTLHAQSYNTALGVRLGYDSGLTLKHFFTHENPGELIIVDAKTFQEVKALPMSKPIGKYNVFNKVTRSEGTSH